MIKNDLLVLMHHPSTKNCFDEVMGESDEEVRLQKMWSIAKGFPSEWCSIVDKYFAIDDDEVACDVVCTGSPPIAPLKCCMCEKTFSDYKRRAGHQWSVHGIKSSVRNHIGDVSQCPICGVDFHCRGRLVKHLQENRVRSKNRTEACQSAFLNSHPPLIAEDILSELEKRDAKLISQARMEGHTNILAKRPCKPTKPSILKKDSRAFKRTGLSKRSSSRQVAVKVGVAKILKPKFRVRGKTSPELLVLVPKLSISADR